MSANTTDVLLVEDDARLAELTSRYLKQNGLTVEVESNGAAAVARFHAVRPRLVLLDLMLPGKDGLTICRELRQTFKGPILMLTAKDADIDQVIGLEAGADDYVAKPAEPMVLLARIRALLRRADGAQQPGADAAASAEIVLGGLRVNEASHRVWLDGEEISLTTQEFELLRVLARSAGTILSREELFKRVRGIEYDGLDRSIDGRISKLRKKLGDDALAPKRIRTIWGKGYLLVPDAW
ncbi:MAG TPA: response regulator [Gammaproteobacteria bacterium]